MENRVISAQEFVRVINNFYLSNGISVDYPTFDLNARLVNYYSTHLQDLDKKYKIALCCICVNAPYWQYIMPMLTGAKQFFLPGHQTDFFIWSDLPESENLEAFKAGEQKTLEMTLAVNNPANHEGLKVEIGNSFKLLQEKRKDLEATIYPLEGIEWPMPTLMRYHQMLQAEEKLKDYDYIFYCDIDMAFVNVVGDEVLGERLTAVQQPMYALRKEWWPPYEPNDKSASYIKRPGKVVSDQGRPRFMPLYFAGGFQGGKSLEFIRAMKVMKQKIDKDLQANYVPVWNDETVWNSYLFENPDDKDVVLTPSYTYPDSLIKEYFEPMWGQSYLPKLITLTKKFSFQPGAGAHLLKMLGETSKLK